MSHSRCAWYATAHSLFGKWQVSEAFRRKKNFKIPSKIDKVRDKSVNCAPDFQHLPSALWYTATS